MDVVTPVVNNGCGDTTNNEYCDTVKNGCGDTTNNEWGDIRTRMDCGGTMKTVS